MVAVILGGLQLASTKGTTQHRMLGWIWVLPISAAIFTLHHVFVLAAYFGTTLTVLGSLGVFIGGVIWSLLHLRTSSLIPGWISHALVDVAIVVVGATMLADQSA